MGNKKRGDRERSEWDLLISNRSFQLGVICVLVALVLVFASINVEHRTDVQEKTIDENTPADDTVRLVRKPEELNRTLELKYNSDTSQNAIVNVTNEDFENVFGRDIVLEPGDEISISLPSNSTYVYVTGYDGVVNLKYMVRYTHQPYRYLSIPGMILTIFGFYYVYKGRRESEMDYAEEEMKRKAEKGEVPDFWEKKLKQKREKDKKNK